MTKRSEIDGIIEAGNRALSSSLALEHVANPFLHFQNAHPNHLNIYAPLRSKRELWKLRFKNAAVVTSNLIFSLFFQSNEEQGDTRPNKCDVLFVSHFVRLQDSGSDADLYYGLLPQELEKSGLTTYTAMLNHSSKSWHTIKPDWKSRSFKRGLIPRRLNFGSEWHHLVKACQASRLLRKLANNSSSQQHQKFYKLAANGSFSSASATAMRMGAYVKILVEQMEPSVIITTFEGHSWERVVFANAKISNPTIKCIGYHHSVIFPMQVSMMKPIDPIFDPDLILTAGKITQRHFLKLSKYHNVDIKVLGSCKAIENDNSGINIDRDKRCLLLPEGIISECISLIEFAIDCANMMPDIEFVIRLHPLNTPQQLISAEPNFANLPPNIIWSDRSLEDDCLRSRWTIYRGSSAVLTAIGYGALPIYYALEDGELSIDPIKTLTQWHYIVKSTQDLQDCFANDLTSTDGNRRVNFLNAITFCNQYFCQFEPEVILKEITN